MLYPPPIKEQDPLLVMVLLQPPKIEAFVPAFECCIPTVRLLPLYVKFDSTVPVPSPSYVITPFAVVPVKGKIPVAP